MLEHGGGLRAAAERFALPLEQWLDLSTGINPDGWPVPPLPPEVWQRLPEANDGLETAAAAYYGNPRLLVVAGSQAAIQTLPHTFSPAVIAFPAPLYNEHPQAWQRAGHRVRQLGGGLPRTLNAATPLVLLCNPNNPTADTVSRPAMVDAAGQLARRGGTLIVDEAFADPTPENSVVDLAGSPEAPNLIVLRSLGKFFGLAGSRVGFVFGAEERLRQMQEILGPWTVSGPARAVARLALSDREWQAATRQRLLAAGQRLGELLAPLGPVTATPLFATVSCDRPAALFEFLARRGILTRSYTGHPLLRFGLPADEDGWLRLRSALNDWTPPC